MIGYSLSFCVQDILGGKVSLDDVFLIESGTSCRTDEDWESMLANYCEVYWKDDPARAREIVQTLRDSGRIEQPRLRGREPRNIASGWWSQPI